MFAVTDRCKFVLSADRKAAAGPGSD